MHSVSATNPYHLKPSLKNTRPGKAKFVLIQIALQTAESNEVAAGGVTNVILRVAVQRVDIPACGVVVHSTFDV